MKPDYKAMTKGELRAYVLSHHEDIEAIRELFDRSEGKRIVFPRPQNLEEMTEMLRPYLEHRKT